MRSSNTCAGAGGLLHVTLDALAIVLDHHHLQYYEGLAHTTHRLSGVHGCNDLDSGQLTYILPASYNAIVAAQLISIKCQRQEIYQ